MTKRKSKFLVPIATVALIGAAVAGCGETTTEADVIQPPLAVAFATDDSVTTHAAGIETAYAEDAAALMNVVIERGGWFKASAFRGSAAAFTVGTLELDPNASLARRRRDSGENAAAIGSSISQVLGLSKMTPFVRDRLA